MCNEVVKLPGLIYLVHLDEGMVVRTEPNGRVVHALHYIGWTADHDRRLAEHSAGRGSSFMAEVERREIPWRVVKMWEGSRTDERKIKNRKESTRFCPVCVASSDSSRGLYVPDLVEVKLDSQLENYV